ncbi:hypothetical protein RUM44_004265 [Polyplax serrata]|uniref:DDHD domain-containing protein n=1 Tax=Polyplax serrata TaxID=468196 RepID=A0ABR1B2R4_POLSC
MSYSGAPNRGVPTDEYLQQRLNKISLDNEVQDEKLYSRNDGGYGTGESYDSHVDPVASTWDYSGPQTKNLDAIVTDLTPEEVRWFYKLEGEKRWLEFSGYDSHHIEMKYREIFDNTTSYSKFSAFSDDTSKPSGSHYTFPGSSSYFGTPSIRFPSKQGNQYSQMSNQNRYGEQLQHKIVVRGGLYDINFETWKCSSIYWPGEECQITRGTWFYEGTWQPLDQEHSRTVESKHLSMFQGHKLSEYVENETKGTVMHTEAFPDFIIEWISPNQIYLYSENTPSKVVRTVSTRLGFRKSTGYRLFRGYKNEASLNDRPDVEITHLVFVIHGIGQKMDTGRIIRNTSRDCVSWLKQKYFSNFPNHRAEFFPVEWRSNLQLDGDLVDAITPNTLQSLRQMLNASAMDIMYYTSPLYGGEVQRGLREELNRLYSMFSARNPYFMNKRGKISIIAHSLGCVILYDIIMGLKPGSLVENNQQGLLFQVQNFFCLGSPLSVFLALRWKDSQIPGKMGVILPQRLCHRLYNVFHPTDPVAYRIEPLLVKGYARVAPLIVQPYNASFRTPYAEMPTELIPPEQGSHDGNSGQGGNNKEEFSPGGTPKDKSWSLWGLRNKGGPRKSTDGCPEPLQEGLDYRLDYILRESNLGVSYLSALTSHTAYWTNYDVAYFILTQIFPEFESNDSSAYPEKNYSEKYSSYAGGNYSQEPQSNYENRNFPQYDGPNYGGSECGPYGGQNVDMGRQMEPPQNINYNQSPRFQQPNYQGGPDFKHPYSQNVDLQGFPTAEHPNYPPPHQVEPMQQGYGPYSLNQQHQGYPQSTNYPPGQHKPTQQNPQQTVPKSYQHPQPHQPPPNYSQQSQPNQVPINYPQHQQQPHPHQQLPHYAQQTHPNQSPGNYQQQQSQPPKSQMAYGQQQIPPHQQLPNFPQQQTQPHQHHPTYPQKQGHHTPQNYPQQSNYPQEHASYQNYPTSQAQNSQASQIVAGPAKNIQTKTGFFDKITEDKKPQGSVSPTKSTKSFFPSFNLSSLTSPVKNLSNSLSNISTQMSNIGKDTMGGNNAAVQSRPAAGFMGSSTQNKTMSPSFTQPSRPQSPQVQYSQGQFGQYQTVSQGPGPNQLLNQNLQQNIRSNSPYEVHSMGIRSGSPVSLQNRCSPMQYGPIETPVGAIKPKTIRLQPKVPSYEQKVQYGLEPTNVTTKTRCVSPLGQSRVICSGSRTSSVSGSYGLPPLGARSLSSGNLRNSTLVSATYPGSRSNFNYLSQSNYVSPTGLDRRTMSRPNLSTTGNSYTGSSLGMSSLVYNSPYGGSRTYLNREYSGPSSR